MHFLHTDARLAADSICDQDALRVLVEGTRALQRVHKPSEQQYLLVKWLLEDASNYHWLGLFCDSLVNRPGCLSYLSRVKSLRISTPSTRLNQLTPFPYVSSTRETETARIVAAYRTSYVESRWRYAEWSSLGCPGWFLRLANSILPERDRQKFLLRVESIGLSRTNDSRGTRTKREDVRDGPVGEIAGPDGEQITLW